MSRIRIIFMVLVPSLLLTLAVLALYSFSRYRIDLDNSIDRRGKDVASFCDALNKNCEDIGKMANVFASILSSKTQNHMSDVLCKSMQEHPDVQTLAVAFDPEFLAKVARGEIPGFKLSHYFDEYRGRTIPNSYAFTVYRGVDGSLYYGNDNVPSYETRDWFLIPKLFQQGRWTGVFKTSEKQWVCAYGLPFYYDRELAGVVSCMVSLESILPPRMTSNDQTTGDRQAFMIVDGYGRVLYHSAMPGWARYSFYSLAKETECEEAFGTIDRLIDERNGFMSISGMLDTSMDEPPVKWLFSSKVGGECDWTIVSVVDRRAVVGQICQGLRRVVVFAFFCMTIIAGVVATLLVYANEPVREMSRVAHEVAAGNLDARISPRYAESKNELGIFARTFNNMVESLDGNLEKEKIAAATQARIEQEADIAQELQAGMLPSDELLYLPERHVALQAKLIPAAEVAGDFCDYWDIGNDSLAFVVADVAGHGAAAIMSMVAARTLMRQVSQKYSSPSDIMTEINTTLLEENHGEIFATVFLGLYNYKSGRLTYCNAGHRPPLVLNAEGQTTVFGYAENVPLGVQPMLCYTHSEITLGEGDSLLVFTNGIVNQYGGTDKGEQYGVRRLRDTLTKQASLTTNRIVPNLARDLEDFCNFGEPEDDAAYFLLKRTTPITQRVEEPWSCDVVFQSEYGRADTLIEDILGQLAERGWSDRDVFGVNMALIEGYNNAVEHGNALDSSKTVMLNCNVSDSHILVAIRDDGPGYNRDAVPDPRQRRRLSCPTGRGVLLIRNFMSRVWFNDAGNVIYMEKYRSEFI